MLGPDTAAVKVVREREAQLTKPLGSLGRMEEIVEWLAAWQGAQRPKVTRPLVAVFAGNHGVTAQGISPFPREVTHQMVANFAAGGAAINQLCIAYDLGLKVFELALELPTGDITVEDAMDEQTCAATMAYGMEAVAGVSICWQSARWASATPPSPPPSCTACSVARRWTGSAPEPGWMRRVSPTRPRSSPRPWRATRAP